MKLLTLISNRDLLSFWYLILILFTSGLLGGLISYFVNFKNLKIPEYSGEEIGSLVGEPPKQSFFLILWDFLSKHWELVAYLTIGVAGSLLVPVTYEILGGLKGLDGINKNQSLSCWQYSVLFGYGIIFAYGSNRFFISILDTILSRLNTNSQKPLDIIITASIGDRHPNIPEQNVNASGPFKKKILRETPEFEALVTNSNANVIYKDEEGTGADQIMTQKLSDAVDILSDRVLKYWKGRVKLRITESWDENNEHANNSLHYEARAVDLTTSDLDSTKLGTLYDLAKTSGFDWIWYEDATHIHASVKA